MLRRRKPCSFQRFMGSKIYNVVQGENEDEEATHHATHDLAGVKVLPGLDKVMDCGAVVLTLKDQSILANGYINEHVDMLEKAEIGEQKRRDEACKVAKKKTGVYDDQFNDEPGSEKKQYFPNMTIQLQTGGQLWMEMGHFTGESEKKLEELRKRLQDVFMGEDEAPGVSEHDGKSGENEVDGWTEVVDASPDENASNENKDEIVPDETIHEVAVGKGLSGALKLLKDRGTLKESIEWGGRNRDKKKSKLVGIVDGNRENDRFKDIRIERTDEFGRIMTPKEAFRMLSHKFHGEGQAK
ncbi:SNU66/SART1 family - like 1 [Theobroma cacao]|nr:SNU66/SART1 family - like 1 [Theobroma cacao]